MAIETGNAFIPGPSANKLSLQQQAQLKKLNRNFNLQNGHAADPEKEKKMADQDKFMKLLIVQMSKQDPLSPMKNTEFMAQMAQFSSLEQMTKVNKSIEKLAQMSSQMQLPAFIGKQIEYRNQTDSSLQTAHVEELLFAPNGDTRLRVVDTASKQTHEISVDEIVSLRSRQTPAQAAAAYEAAETGTAAAGL